MVERRDIDKLKAAFAEFRVLGYWARMSQEDGWRAVPEDVIRRSGAVVFWHANESRGSISFDGTIIHPLHIRHLIRDTDQIERVLRQNGLNVIVERSDLGGVVVLPGPMAALPVTDAARATLGRQFTWRMLTDEGEIYVDVSVTEVDEAGGKVRLTLEDYPGTWVTMPLKILGDSILCGMTKNREPEEAD